MSLAEVRFLPSGRALQVPKGTSLLEAARRAGLPLASSCDGEVACGWCSVQVLEGQMNLTAMGPNEQQVLARIDAGAVYRLACQARVQGEVVITTSYW